MSSAPQSNSLPTYSSSFSRLIILTDWWLIKSETDVDGRRLAVCGYQYSSCKAKTMHIFTSAPVVKRYNSSTVVTADGSTVSLKGDINGSRTQQNGFPPEVSECFLSGFPRNWEDCAKIYFGPILPNAESHYTSEMDNDDLEINNEKLRVDDSDVMCSTVNENTDVLPLSGKEGAENGAKTSSADASPVRKDNSDCYMLRSRGANMEINSPNCEKKSKSRVQSTNISEIKEKPQRRGRPRIMNCTQIRFTEQALMDNPGLQLKSSTLEDMSKELSAHGPKITASQLKSWITNRNTKLTRAAVEASGTSHFQFKKKPQWMGRPKIMNDEQIRLIENATQGELSAVEKFSKTLSAKGPGITPSQLKNWLKNRKAKAQRACKNNEHSEGKNKASGTGGK